MFVTLFSFLFFFYVVVVVTTTIAFWRIFQQVVFDDVDVFAAVKVFSCVKYKQNTKLYIVRVSKYDISIMCVCEQSEK